MANFQEGNLSKTPLSFVVIGASGDLAKKKIFPALFALFCQDFLPEKFSIYGFSRHDMTQDGFRDHIMSCLTCRYMPETSDCAKKMNQFISRCHYVAGQYDSTDSFRELAAKISEHEGDMPTNRMYYMAIPPFLFLPVAQSLADAEMIIEKSEEIWSRVVIEKPFGKDRESSDELVNGMSKVFSEEQSYRIDHYLGKEVIQNLLVLRFANSIFSPIWSRGSIESVRISWKENIGISDRGGYFDEYGIIRDVMQNHLLQILSLVAMERPKSFTANAIRDAKINVLNNIKPIELNNIVLGQYSRGVFAGKEHPAYREATSVPDDSLTPTFASTVVHVDTPRWEGVPFMMCAGKGMESSMTEIRIKFKPVPDGFFPKSEAPLSSNELVVRVQPRESISFHIINKVPGLGMKLVNAELDLQYESAFPVLIPDAYECLLLDVIRGDKSLFISAEELEAAWDIFTPVLHEIDQCKIEPQPYVFGGASPDKTRQLVSKYGIQIEKSQDFSI